MPQYRAHIGPIVVIGGILMVLPWGALYFAGFSIGLAVLCAVCSVLALLTVVLLAVGRKKQEKARCEQLRLYLAAIEVDAPQNADSDALLTCLGENAAAQKTAHTNSEILTARFLTDWSKKTIASLDALQASEKRVVATLPVEERLLKQEVNTLRCLSEQLMRYFNCDTDCSLYRIQTVDLMRIMSDAVIRRSDELKARKIGLRRSAAKLRVTSDPVLLAAVLDELLDNAIRHTPENGTIGLTCREASGAAEITVEDAGCGIPPEELPRVFERGFVGRGETMGRAGLGLFTARAYCELLGHRLQVRSAVGKGTQAVLRIQIAPSEKEKETENTI